MQGYVEVEAKLLSIMPCGFTFWGDNVNFAIQAHYADGVILDHVRGSGVVLNYEKLGKVLVDPQEYEKCAIEHLRGVIDFAEFDHYPVSIMKYGNKYSKDVIMEINIDYLGDSNDDDSIIILVDVRPWEDKYTVVL